MRKGPGVLCGCRAVFLRAVIHTGTRAKRHPITPMPTAGRRHACELKRCAVDWYGIERSEWRDDRRQADVIDPVLRY